MNLEVDQLDHPLHFVQRQYRCKQIDLGIHISANPLVLAVIFIRILDLTYIANR